MLIPMEQRVANIRNGLSSSGEARESPFANVMDSEPEPSYGQSSMSNFDDIKDIQRKQQEAQEARAAEEKAEARRIDVFNNALSERAAYSRYVSNVGNPATAGGSNFLRDGQNMTQSTVGKFNMITGKQGNKAFRNNNPGNITGMGGRLLYGAVGFAKSKHGDAGDQNQLVFDSPEAGTKAMYGLMSGGSYNNAPISQAFSKWQTDKKAWANMKQKYRGMGIDVDRQRFNDLSPQQKYNFMNVRAKHEGFQGDIPNIF